MAHVITQACCADGACTTVCPVDCIHPTPAEREYLVTEMLYIDPDTCIDCGQCVPECPVDAIYSGYDLPDHLASYAAINAEYFKGTTLGDVPRRVAAPPELHEDQPLRVAIVGSGPAGSYSAHELVEVGGSGIRVDIFDRLPTPFGLARLGVAPDHLGTKLVMRTFSELGADPRVRFHLNTEIGRDITVEELREHYHAVFFTHGASSSRRLGIEGEDLPGSHAATQFVAWYNGHPDSPKPRGWQPPSHVVVIGNGNVAIDVARQLTLGPEHLAASDMAPYAVDVLSRGLVKDVTVVGRRSALHAACTLPELEALADRTDIDVVVPPEDLVLTDHELAAVRESGMLRLKYELFRTLSERPHTRERSITFRFLLTPQRILGESHAEGIELARNRMVSLGDRTVLEPTGETTVLPTNLVLRSVGYAGVELPGLPFDEATMTVPTDGARVLTEPGGEVIPGLYSAGWVKRGPSGVMGTNKLDAQGTVKVLLDDVRAGRIAAPAKSLDDLDRLLRQRQPQVVPWQGWQAIEAHELAHGTETGRPRVKVTSREALVEFAAARLSTETEEQ